MAKAKVKDAPKSALDEVFSQLIGQHNAVTKGSAAMGNAMDSEIKYWIDTGCLTLNMLLSNRPDGGWPCGRVVEVFGKESTGKSTLGYVAMANAQKAGGIAIYVDIEKTGNPDFMKLLGVDINKLITSDIPEIEKLFTALERNLTLIANTKEMHGKPVMIVVDSVTALQTDSEMEGGYEFNMNVALGKAKQMGKALRKITPFLSKANACLYFVNQVRDNITGYGEKHVIPGGNAIPFYSSIRVHLEGRTKLVVKDMTLENEYQDKMAAYKAAGGKKAGLIAPEKPKDSKENETTIGYEVSAFTKKNKTAPSDRRMSFQIVFSQGLFDEPCWLDQCIKYGIVKAEGSKRWLVGIEGVEWPEFTKKTWLKRLQADEDTYEKIRAKLIEKLTIPYEYKTDDIHETEITADNADDYSVPGEAVVKPKSKSKPEPEADEDGVLIESEDDIPTGINLND